MIKRWKKLGQIYKPPLTNQHPKLYSHAANPLPIHLKNDVFRIFYSGRDKKNRSSVGAVDIDIIRQEIITEHQDPFFMHGPKNSFFSDGVSIGNCYEVQGVRYILFMGWQNPKNEHWRGDIGRLILTDDLSLELESSKPFLSSNENDPLSLSYPWVMKRKNLYQMWYGSTHTWNAGNDEMLHAIHYASSEDGHTWDRHGVGIPYEVGVAQAFSRPSVVENANGFLEMWFSFRSGRGETYRIGYATCDRTESWTLNLENSGIDISQTGWDSEMIEYPFVFDHAGSRFMLYNGNSFGKTGFGLAVLEETDIG